MNGFISVLSFRIVKLSPERLRCWWCACLCAEVEPHLLSALAACVGFADYTGYIFCSGTHTHHGISKLILWSSTGTNFLLPVVQSMSPTKSWICPGVICSRQGHARTLHEGRLIRWHAFIWARFPLLREHSASWWALAALYKRFRAILCFLAQSRGENIIPSLGETGLNCTASNHMLI